MATENAQHAPGAGSAAEERYAYMLLYAPGGTGEAGEPVRGGAWLQEQARMLAGAVPGLDAEPDGRVGELGPSLSAVVGRGAAGGLVSQDEGGCMRLTPPGLRAAGALWEGADGAARRAVSKAKRLLNGMDYWELVSFACTALDAAGPGPGIAAEFGRRRLGAAVSLASRHAVSISRAAAIAGMGTVAFEGELKRRGIRPYYTDGRRLTESMKVIDRITGR